MAAELCSEKELLCLQSAGTHPILQMHRLVCIISSSKCVKMAEMAIFFDLPLWFSAVPMDKCRKRFCMHLTSYSFCAQRLFQGAFGNFDNLFGVLR